MTVLAFDHEEFLDLLGVRLDLRECEAKVALLGAAPEGIEGSTLRFDVSPNRPDLLSVEGLARAMRGFLGLETGLPEYDVPRSGVVFDIDRSVDAVRPHAVGALVRDVEFTDAILASLIELQEHLHLTHGRRRRKVAIGIHDADKVSPPFTYRAVKGDEVRFVPLGMAEEMTLAAILARHEKGREYGAILADHERYPVILDAEGRVLSFPPIINGMVTQLSPATRNLFVDVTGTDPDAVDTALVIVATSLAERGARIEAVELRTPTGSRLVPDLAPRTHEFDVAAANELLGLSLGPDEAAECLRRMRHDATPSGDGLVVRTPRYRADILATVDLVEDVAIGYGYDRIPGQLPRRQTIGSLTPLTDFVDALRILLVGQGYQEVMSLDVSAPEEPWTSPPRVPIVNPVAAEHSRIRSSVVPALLSLLAINKHRDLPQRVFEVSDVVRDGRNVRMLGAVSLHARAGFTEAKSLMQGLLRDVGCSYAIESAEDPNFIEGRCAAVNVDGTTVGMFGEVHPRVLVEYGLGHPAVTLEVTVADLR